MEANSLPESRIARVRGRIARSHSILAITGAGISGKTRDAPARFATPEGFAADPEAAWRWYDKCRQEVARAEPNVAHLALARLERQGKRVFIVTQNVDDLHERAGSTEVVHIHGSIWRTRCERNGTVEENREVPLAEIPPLCACGSELRPDVVWFGESLLPGPLEQINRHLLAAESNVCLVVGIEATFGHVVQWAHAAKEQGALLVTVNPRRTVIDELADLHLAGPAAEILPLLVP
ncbi:NAD-dependent deacylase [candidate division WOR-3 bacterium]|nr:NAD-dependent deacylase [candidate division WOR-3 bacterium]